MYNIFSPIVQNFLRIMRMLNIRFTNKCRGNFIKF